MIRVDPSWSDPDWRSELIRSDICACLYYNKKNPVELEHCEMSSSYRVFYPMKLKPQKER